MDGGAGLDRGQRWEAPTPRETSEVGEAVDVENREEEKGFVEVRRREREVEERMSSTGGHNRGKFLKKALATREIKVEGEKKRKAGILSFWDFIFPGWNARVLLKFIKRRS